MLPFRPVVVSPEKPLAPSKAGLGARLAGVSPDEQLNIAPTVIGPDSTFTGDLETKSQLQVDGEVNGEIRGSSVVIGEQGRVTGGIVAEEIVVSGHVMGSIRGKRVLLQSSSRVEGDIFNEQLVIEEGAAFEGRLHRIQNNPSLDSVPPQTPNYPR
jgi:cytoskeletal protein CcmA (bactofilin family)